MTRSVLYVPALVAGFVAGLILVPARLRPAAAARSRPARRPAREPIPVLVVPSLEAIGLVPSSEA